MLRAQIYDYPQLFKPKLRFRSFAREYSDGRGEQGKGYFVELRKFYFFACMELYMVRFVLPEMLGNDIASKIPEHRERVNALISEGKILSYAVARDRSQGWITLVADSERELNTLLNSLPLAPFLKFEKHALMVFDARNLRFPEFTMN